MYRLILYTSSGQYSCKYVCKWQGRWAWISTANNIIFFDDEDDRAKAAEGLSLPLRCVYSGTWTVLARCGSNLIMRSIIVEITSYFSALRLGKYDELFNCSVVICEVLSSSPRELLVCCFFFLINYLILWEFPIK